ncbi:hypothetical protein Vi05172_g9624 [Venturia inaequalis]|nr:hypothetical protein Vi05172_g9624 [Venturia inaequalis]
MRLFLHKQSYGRGLSKGQSSIRHDGIANNAHLAEVGNSMQFPTFINKNISHAGGISEKAMAATVEAVIGAAFLDGGLNAVQTVIVKLGLQ